MNRLNLAATVAVCLSVAACDNSRPDNEQVLTPEAANDAVPAAPPPQLPAPAEGSTPVPGKATQTAVPTDAEVEAQFSSTLNNCLASGDAAKGVTSAMSTCIGDELQLQDVNLNQVYNAALARLGPQQQEALRVEQRAWISARDSKCEKTRSGGTIDAVQVPMCLLEETVRRRLILQG